MIARFRPPNKHWKQSISKPENMQPNLLHVTKSRITPDRVTLTVEGEDSKRYNELTGKVRAPIPPRAAQLEPWLGLVNLLQFEPNGAGGFAPLETLTPDDQNRLHVAFTRWFDSLPFGESRSLFFPLSDWVRGRSRLIQTYRDARAFLERVPAMAWSSRTEPFELSSDAAYEEVPFPIMQYAGGTDDGRIRFQADPLREALKTALEGAEIRRMRRCPICGRFFYARRVTQQACSKGCNSTRRVRAWREKQAEYEHNRKLRSAGVKPERKAKR